MCDPCGVRRSRQARRTWLSGDGWELNHGVVRLYLGQALAAGPVRSLERSVVTKTPRGFCAHLRREGTTTAWIREMLSFEEFNSFIGLSGFWALEHKYRVEES